MLSQFWSNWTAGLVQQEKVELLSITSGLPPPDVAAADKDEEQVHSVFGCSTILPFVSVSTFSCSAVLTTVVITDYHERSWRAVII